MTTETAWYFLMVVLTAVIWLAIDAIVAGGSSVAPLMFGGR